MSEVVEKTIINLNIPSEILWALLALGILFFLIMAPIFHHHWNYYGVTASPKVFAKSLFWIGSVILILIMALAITAFEIL